MAARKPPPAPIVFASPPTLAEVMACLEGLGTEQTRKTWRRHGTAGPCFGVLYGDMERVVKALVRTQAPLLALADDLWATDNHDARVLASKILPDHAATAPRMLAWIGDCHDYGLADAVARAAARSPAGLALAPALCDDPREYFGRMGWRLVVYRALAEDADDASLETWLMEVAEVLSTAPERVPNRKREAMYDALMAIGGAREALRVRALEAAERIGKLYVDHGDTHCKTPDAGPYIVKMVMHRAAQAAKARSKT